MKSLKVNAFGKTQSPIHRRTDYAFQLVGTTNEDGMRVTPHYDAQKGGNSREKKIGKDSIHVK